MLEGRLFGSHRHCPRLVAICLGWMTLLLVGAARAAGSVDVRGEAVRSLVLWGERMIAGGLICRHQGPHRQFRRTTGNP